MSDRPKWMPDPYECKEAWCRDDAEIPGFPGVETLAHRTGLRAQVAVLEGLVELFKVRSCPCGLQILDKISALRKELAGE